MPRKAPILAPIDPGPRELSSEELCAEGALPIKAAAAFIGVGMSTMRELIAARTIPSLKIGVRVIVPKRGLVLYLAKQLPAA